ncbi:uncharacterized protein RHO25_007113 [Cercospora beticola]|uniref:Uncharacterized protein n=1 Tax=Cercospora beticola TaxID=122368 RepID=A0ABZ0NSN3_CERBT|nr:hypothetical protein RHO25_007113 [Cercospora beticola]
MSQLPLCRMPTSASKSQFIQVSTEYKPAPTEEIHELKTSLPVQRSAANPRHARRNRSSRRPWWKILPMQFFCLAWTGPIIYLLFLNAKHHVVGASAWCPKHDCWVDAFNNQSSMVQSSIAALAVRSRNLNNILQYVAKILELWFSVIAAALMYLMVMRVAQSRYGSPVRHLTLPIEFSNLLAVFDGGLYQDMFSEFYWTVVVVASIFMGILVNLMGPATATLILPTLEWVETDRISQGYFYSINTNVRIGEGEGDLGPSSFVLSDSGCSIDDLALGRYSYATQ